MKRYYTLTMQVVVDAADDVDYVEEQLTGYVNRVDEIDDCISVTNVQLKLDDVK